MRQLLQRQAVAAASGSDVTHLVALQPRRYGSLQPAAAHKTTGHSAQNVAFWSGKMKVVVKIHMDIVTLNVEPTHIVCSSQALVSLKVHPQSHGLQRLLIDDAPLDSQHTSAHLNLTDGAELKFSDSSLLFSAGTGRCCGRRFAGSFNSGSIAVDEGFAVTSNIHVLLAQLLQQQLHVYMRFMMQT